MAPSKVNFANFTLLQHNLPHKTAQSAAGPSCGDPKTGLRGSLHTKKCWEAFYTVPRHHTITMGPYRGVPRAPWIRQKPTWKNFAVFQLNLPYETHAQVRAAVFCDPKARLRGSLRAKKVLEGLPYRPKTPHNRYGTLPWGPWGTLDLAKPNLEKCHRFPAKFAPPIARAGARSGFWGPPNPACGGPCGQTNAQMPPTVPPDTTESV